MFTTRAKRLHIFDRNIVYIRKLMEQKINQFQNNIILLCIDINIINVVSFTRKEEDHDLSIEIDAPFK